MDIEVSFFGTLRELAGRQQVISMTEGAQLTDLIERLAREYGAEFRQEVNCIEKLRILINGQEYELLDNVQTQLKDGDIVVFLSLIAGG